MAEFQEVMREWVRSRKAINENELFCYPLEMFTDDHIANIEKEVMSWAAEHPEPVYPTWKEWLEEQRVVVHFDSVSEKGTKVKWELTNKSNCRIPADIAEKLGIEPKEDV